MQCVEENVFSKDGRRYKIKKLKKIETKRNIS